MICCASHRLPHSFNECVINLCDTYEGVSINNQTGLFITDRHSQDFQSLSCQHIKAYVQSLSIMGSLVDNLSRLKAWPVSQKIVFHRIRLLRKSFYLMNIFSKKYVVCICNISTERKMCRLHDDIKRKDCTIILT